MLVKSQSEVSNLHLLQLLEHFRVNPDGLPLLNLCKVFLHMRGEQRAGIKGGFGSGVEWSGGKGRGKERKGKVGRGGEGRGGGGRRAEWMRRQGDRITSKGSKKRSNLV